jgi:hypothetical protein
MEDIRPERKNSGPPLILHGHSEHDGQRYTWDGIRQHRFVIAIEGKKYLPI